MVRGSRPGRTSKVSMIPRPTSRAPRARRRRTRRTRPSSRPSTRALGARSVGESSGPTCRDRGEPRARVQGARNVRPCAPEVNLGRDCSRRRVARGCDDASFLPRPDPGPRTPGPPNSNAPSESQSDRGCDDGEAATEANEVACPHARELRLGRRDITHKQVPGGSRAVDFVRKRRADLVHRARVAPDRPRVHQDLARRA